MLALNHKIEKFTKEHGLSSRQKDVLEELVKGNVTSIEIGKALGISANTARIHIKSINSRVGVHSKAAVLSQLIRFSTSE